MKKKMTVIFLSALFVLGALAGAWFYLRGTVADEYYVRDKSEFEIAGSSISVRVDGEATAASLGGGSFTGTARLFGVIPLKTVKLRQVPENSVVIGGDAFGLKMYTNGLIVVGFSDVKTERGSRNPALEAGIEKGDLLKTVNGVRLAKNSDVASLINASGGAEATLVLERSGERMTVTLSPALSAEDGKYKLGMWVRDSAAGIGTVSFYEPETGLFVGLGHGIYDTDTETLMPAAKGEIVKTTITGVKRGEKGSPGELYGVFDQETVIGELHGNSALGVYGKLTNAVAGEELPIALKQEIEVGDAKLITPAIGGGKAEYDVRITSVVNDDRGSGRNMIIKITDEKLLELTGGIVQGMSGSPIVRDGKIVGAVTHVLVNDPTCGYAVFAERMYELIG
ncbi:MAG: SpoIVB peptidase [Clostridia bacterium]|nr:SpoIVB peptidase [Clostridia bacterium]